MKPVIGSLMLLLVFLMVIHSFWKWSRQFPPAHEREPSGVEGGLIVLVGFMAAAVLFNATGFGLMVSAVMGAFGSHVACIRAGVRSMTIASSMRPAA